MLNGISCKLSTSIIRIIFVNILALILNRIQVFRKFDDSRSNYVNSLISKTSSQVIITYGYIRYYTLKNNLLDDDRKRTISKYSTKFPLSKNRYEIGTIGTGRTGH